MITDKGIEQFKRLREIFPEIPEYCISLTIEMSHDSYPEVTVNFHPSDVMKQGER